MIKSELEPEVEPHFHNDSYGYRPNKSALDAVGIARKRCWRYDWVLDLDIRGFFDNMDHHLLMKAVRKHTNTPWVILYIERWLVAPVLHPDGRLESRSKGSPQGSVISPLLTNLFLHYAFDRWMSDNHPNIPFERYADDGVCHCKTRHQAEWLRKQVAKRLKECGLELHPAKTKIVYCQDSDRKMKYDCTSFDFLGYTFRPRRSKNRWGKYFVNFSPAISNAAAKRIRNRIRHWKLHCRIDKKVRDLANMFNPVIQGWINYYGRFYPSALYPSLRYLDRRLVFWAMAKYKRLRKHKRRTSHWLARICAKHPWLFAHWRFLKRQTVG